MRTHDRPEPARRDRSARRDPGRDPRPADRPYGGRHELGQNHLRDPGAVARIVELVRATSGPILELGGGDGALTAPLERLGRPLAAIELDPRRARELRARLPGVEVRQADVLRSRLDRPVIVGNIPFHITTPIMRRLLGQPGWSDAVLLTQWEVARRRAGVGGRTLLTAQHDPWFEFALHGRVPARAFRPVPGVDGGILSIRRRARPLIDPRDRGAFERFARNVFQGSGRRLDEVVARAAGADRRSAARALAEAGAPAGALPRDLDARAWAHLWSVLARSARRPRSSRR